MRIYTAILLFVLFSVTTLAAVERSAEEWTTLFDASTQTLEDWTQRGGKAKYTIEDGTIVGRSVPNTSNSFLCTNLHYGDFVLELEFKVHPALNSGIQIRSNSIADYKDGRVHGYQFEIDPSDRAWTAGIYDEGRRGWLYSLAGKPDARAAFKQNDWNHVRVVANGNSIKTFLNGIPAADLMDSMTPTGFIALQVHGVGDREDALDVRWREIRIQGKPVASSADSSVANDSSTADSSIIVKNAEVQTLHEGFEFTEGPAEGPDGKIYFTDIPNSRIHAYDPSNGQLIIHREKTGKANGLMFDKAGALYACEGGNRQVTKQVGNAITVLADKYEGKRFNSPNDLDIDGRGGIYFTDPRYGDRSDMEMQVEGVYYISPDGALSRVIDDLVRPNGLILSLDNKTLYVADNGATLTYAYDVNRDGSLANRRLFSDAGGQGGGDGMTIDAKGNVYTTAQGHVLIWTPDGKLAGKITLPEAPANCTFGGPNNKTLFMTARKGFYSVEMNVAGHE